MNQDELKRFQNEELKVLKCFASYCDKFGLRYYLLGGTLLGAIRHHGFIPWDDDVDVCMPRSDYNMLIERMKIEALPEPFRFLTFENNPDYRYPWARLISTNMKIINRTANIPRVEHAWVDIIPLDAMPDGVVERSLHKMRLSALWDLNNLVQFDELVDQKRSRGTLGKAAIKVSSAIHGLVHSINYKKLLKKLTDELERYPYDSDTKFVINFLAAYGFSETFPRECFEETEYYPFEDTVLAGPKDYKTVLNIIYGEDYMTLPPESERNKHNSELVEEPWEKSNF